MTAESPLLRLTGLTKRFPGVTALADVSIDVRAGEVLGLLGENGAGKSTLLKIVSGAQQPDAGTIEWDGAPVTIASPHRAQALGIVTIYQEFNLVPDLSIAENVFIGREPVRGGLIDWARLRAETVAVTRRIGLDLDPMLAVRELSVAEQQMVEIARALSMQSRLIIMDEPTSALSETEVTRLLRIMDGLRAEGLAVIFVTHRLSEAMGICDRVTVLRDGRLVGTRPVAGLAMDELIRMMVGRSADQLYRRPATRHAPGAVRLRVKGLNTEGVSRHGTVLHGIDLEVRQGEILGIAGLVGAGRTEFVRAVFGADHVFGGSVEVDGAVVRIRSPRDAIRAGIGLVPEDRKLQALFLSQAVRSNFSIAALAQFLWLGIFTRERAEAAALETYRRALKIRMSSGEQSVINLSGGNQQKVVLARWLALRPKVLIVDEPTRGVDIAAKAEVHELLDELAGRGIAVVAISSELPEVLAISDRIVTMREGRITGELAASDASQERLMGLMTLERGHDAPSPLVGEGRGGGTARETIGAPAPLPPAPSHKGRGRSGASAHEM
jgi:inositol transport system ATP-binding protein